MWAAWIIASWMSFHAVRTELFHAGTWLQLRGIKWKYANLSAASAWIRISLSKNSEYLSAVYASPILVSMRHTLIVNFIEQKDFSLVLLLFISFNAKGSLIAESVLLVNWIKSKLLIFILQFLSIPRKKNQRKEKRFFPTRLALNFTTKNAIAPENVIENSNVNNTTSSKLQLTDDNNYEGNIIVETNYRVYAYTDSKLQISLLALFTELLYRFPNVTVGVITRDSIRQALRGGITARQIISYLEQHAHPKVIYWLFSLKIFPYWYFFFPLAMSNTDDNKCRNDSIQNQFRTSTDSHRPDKVVGKWTKSLYVHGRCSLQSVPIGSRLPYPPGLCTINWCTFMAEWADENHGCKKVGTWGRQKVLEAIYERIITWTYVFSVEFHRESFFMYTQMYCCWTSEKSFLLSLFKKKK